MRVLEASEIIRNKENEETQQIYSTEFIAYNQRSQSFVIRIHRHSYGDIPMQSYTVEMNTSDIDALQRANHIKGAFDYAQKISEGYRPIGIYFVLFEDDVLIDRNMVIDMADYVYSNDGFMINDKTSERRTGLKVYWISLDEYDGTISMIENLGGRDKIKNDIKQDIEKWEENK